MADQGVPPQDAGAVSTPPQEQQLPGMPADPVKALGLTPGVGPGSPPLSDGTTKPDIIAITAGLVRAVGSMADKAIAGADARDAKDYGQAALYFAQAAITMDPSRTADGSDPMATAAAALGKQQFPSPRDYDERGDGEGGRDKPVTPKLPATTDRDHDGRIGE